MTDTTNMQPKLELEREICSRCGGSGSYSYCQRYGTTCFRCGGKKVVLTKRGALAAEFLRWLRSVPARDLKVGDRIRTDGLTADYAPHSYWATVIEIKPVTHWHRSWTSPNGYRTGATYAIHSDTEPDRGEHPDIPWEPCQYLDITTENKKLGAFGRAGQIVAAASEILKTWPQEYVTATLEKAIEFQNSLNKNGKLRAAKAK